MGPDVFIALPSLLGLRPGMKVCVVGAPAGFSESFAPLPPGVELVPTAKTGLDLTIFFTRHKVELVEKLPALARGMAVTGRVWVCFPAESEGERSPTEDFVRFAALEAGLTDDKHLLLGPRWAGLRLAWKPRAPRLEKPQVQA